MIYYLDANIFLRTLIIDNKKYHADCVNLLRKIKENKIEAITGTVILAEVAWTLNSYYQFPKEKVIKGVQSIINLRGLRVIDDYQHLLALELYEKYAIKYIDAVISSSKMLQEKKACLISYDKDFDKLPILKKEPKEVIDLVK